MKISLVILLVILLSSCAAKGSKFDNIQEDIPKLAESNSRLYFLRDDELFYSGISAPITINGNKFGRVKIRGFIYVDVPAGEQKVETDYWSAPGEYIINLLTEAGATYYLQIAPNETSTEPGMLFGLLGQLIVSASVEQSGAFKITLIEEKTALALLANMSYSDE